MTVDIFFVIANLKELLFKMEYKLTSFWQYYSKMHFGTADGES